MKVLFKLLLDNWKLVVAVIVLGLITLHYVGLRDTIADQRVKIAELTTENTVLLGNNKLLQKSIDANNEAITKMAESADQTKDDFAKLNNSVRQQTAKLEKRLADILKDARPETCDATIQYLIDAVEEYKK